MNLENTIKRSKKREAMNEHAMHEVNQVAQKNKLPSYVRDLTLERSIPQSIPSIDSELARFSLSSPEWGGVLHTEKGTRSGFFVASSLLA